ncbi:MAG: hypothetical protein AAB263_21425 [Planctomycetota bacterium]
MLETKCQCGKLIKAPFKYAGKTIKCPACGNPLLIPALFDEKGDRLGEQALRAEQKSTNPSNASTQSSSSSQFNTGVSAKHPATENAANTKTGSRIPQGVWIGGGLCLGLVFLGLIISPFFRSADRTEQNTQLKTPGDSNEKTAQALVKKGLLPIEWVI